MADLATIKSAPAGTQIKTAQSSEWVEAHVDDVLHENDEIQNTESNAYTLGLLSGGGIVFDDTGTVDLSNISGLVKYRTADNQWVTVTSDGEYLAQAVGAAEGGGVVMVCARRGWMRSKPWST